MLQNPLSIGPGRSGLRRKNDGSSPAVRLASQPAASLHHPARALLLGMLAVMAIASFNLFHRLSEPAQPIWDESYYLTSTARYELGYASFASHPPLGLMLIAAGDRLSGVNVDMDWRPIAADKKITGNAMPAGFSYFGVRCASALFGVAAAGLGFLLMAELAGGAMGGLLACSPFLFDTALLAQFRAAQLDSFQLCFAAGALFCLVRADRGRDGGWPFGFGVACGLAAMVRANGILLLAGAVLPILRFASDRSGLPSRAAVLARHGLATLFGVVLAVAAVFFAHVAVARRPMPPTWAAARADARFIGPSYRTFLDGRSRLSPGVVIEAIDGYRRFIAADLAGVGVHDNNGSSPWAWPLGMGAITYRWDSNGQTTSYVALVPNRAGWLVSLVGVVGGLSAVMGWPRRSRAKPGERLLLWALLSVWAVLFLSDVVLAQSRVMYLYHYFLPLTLGWALAAVLLAQLPGAAARVLPQVALALVLACFVLMSPLSLHEPLTDGACSWRQAVSDRRLCEHRDIAVAPRIALPVSRT